MKLIVREHRNFIAEPKKTVYKVYVDLVNSYNKIPASIGLMKGDIIIFRGEGDPVRFSAGNASGKTIVTDPASPTGWVLGEGGGGGGKAKLKNASGAQVTTGTIVYVFDTDNYGREAIKAPYWQEGRYYIVAEDTASGADMDCYCLPGSNVQVLVSGTCSIGDPLVVSSTAGIAIAIPGGTPTVGIAQENKTSSAVGLVDCLLVENKTVSAQNADSASHISGTVYALSSGHETDSMGTILPNATPVVKGKRPYGVQANAQADVDSPMLLHAKPGEIATVLADSNEVKVGDWLIPSDTETGRVKNGTGYGLGYAMSPKASGSNGEVKIRLYPAMYGYSSRITWYLPDGIDEEQVLGAWQFIGSASEQDALKNINKGTEYVLTKYGNTVVWNQSDGFTIPATADYGLDNSTIRSNASQILSVAFRYSGCYVGSSNYYQGGVMMNKNFFMILNGGRDGSYHHRPVMNRYTNYNQGIYSTVYTSGNQLEHGVFGGNPNEPSSTKSEMFFDGIKNAVTNTSNYSGYTKTIVSMVSNAPDGLTSLYPWKIQALVLYTTKLTDAQHLELAQNMNAL